MSESKSYSHAGVDIRAADRWVEGLQKAASRAAGTEGRRLISGIGDYAAIYALSDEQWVATSCDGVGTKLLWTQQGLGTGKALAQDLLAMNCNDLLCVGATPKLFLDYIAIGSRALLAPGSVLEDFIQGLHEACSSTGQLLVGGETAQMPDVYGQHGFDLAGFSVGFLRPTERLSVEAIRPGSQLWAWPSSGPHSSGFSWLRRLYDPKKDEAFIREKLMAPTALYVNELRKLREKVPLQAAYHITGSGLLNLVRAQPQGREIGFNLSYTRKEWPDWAQDLAARSGASPTELYTTFNMGLGFVVVLERALGEAQADLLDSMGLSLIGEATDRAEVRIEGLSLS